MQHSTVIIRILQCFDSTTPFRIRVLPIALRLHGCDLMPKCHSTPQLGAGVATRGKLVPFRNCPHLGWQPSMSIYSPIVTCTSVLTRSRLLFLPRRRLPVAWVCYAAGDMSWQLVDSAANGYVVDDQGSPSLAQGLHYTMY